MRNIKDMQERYSSNMKKAYVKDNGITLIALVITIIVTLILAGVSIGVLTGENGLISNAAESKKQSEIAQEKEILQQAAAIAMGKSKNGIVEKVYLDPELEKYSEVDGTEDVDKGVEVTFKSQRMYLVGKNGNVSPVAMMPIQTDVAALTTPVIENTKYDDGTDIAVIPEGFRVSSNPDEQKVDTGLVVLDDDDNEWVWIPVPDATVMYTKTNEGIAITGGSGKTYVSGITTNYYSNSEILSGITRDLPNTALYREPDIVVGTNGISNDNANSTVDTGKKNYETAGFTSLQNMAQSLVDDYEEMIKSVEKNKGFYVGRYELSGTVALPTEQGSKAPVTNQNWYYLYKACKSFSKSAVESRMIWGCQWDMVCTFISERGDKKNITNSTGWGNYYDSVVLASDGTIKKYGGVAKKYVTGFTTYTRANMIYDIAGNCWEFTQETYGNNYHMARGGYYWDSYGSSNFAASRASDNRRRKRNDNFTSDSLYKNKVI